MRVQEPDDLPARLKRGNVAIEVPLRVSRKMASVPAAIETVPPAMRRSLSFTFKRV